MIPIPIFFRISRNGILNEPWQQLIRHMKNLIIIFLVLSGYFSSAQSLDNQKVIEKLFLEGWNKKDLSNISEHIGDTISFHLNNYHFKTNATELRQLINLWHVSFEDFKFEIINIISKDDIVAINLRYTGKHVAEFMGVKPKNKEISVSEMMFFRFDNGKIVEAWELYDEKGMFSQITSDNRP
jgi:steroid delta-isomerase-like uncharacterized protein